MRLVCATGRAAALSLAIFCLAATLLPLSGQRRALQRKNYEMVLIPGGSFEMGRSSAEIDRAMKVYGISHRDVLSPESPRHAVRISPFFIDKYEVTNSQFREFLLSNPQWRRAESSPAPHNGHYLETWNDVDYPAGTGDHPVVFVTWYAAFAYCDWREKRLPTEAEWEFAARGGLPDPEFPWGNGPPDVSLANFTQTGVHGVTSVGRYLPNGYLLYDMAGNAWEYCLDEWQADYYEKSGRENPIAGQIPSGKSGYLSVRSRRVIRGGSYDASPVNLRVTYRDSHPPDGAGDHVGFRCACSK